MALGCKGLERFDTRGDAAFCGDMVSGPAFNDGFIADGQPPNLSVRLELDSSQLSSFSDNKTAQPGNLTSDDAEEGLCGEQALFEASPLRSIPQVYHDSLATLTFGEGHDEDLFTWVDSTCQGTMLALVSLLSNGDTELRLFKPAPLDASADKRAGYALFYLQRNEKGCGF